MPIQCFHPAEAGLNSCCEKYEIAFSTSDRCSTGKGKPLNINLLIKEYHGELQFNITEYMGEFVLL